MPCWLGLLQVGYLGQGLGDNNLFPLLILSYSLSLFLAPPRLGLMEGEERYIIPI